VEQAVAAAVVNTETCSQIPNINKGHGK